MRNCSPEGGEFGIDGGIASNGAGPYSRGGRGSDVRS